MFFGNAGRAMKLLYILRSNVALIRWRIIQCWLLLSRGICGNGKYIEATGFEDDIIFSCKAYLKSFSFETAKAQPVNTGKASNEVDQLKRQIQNLIDNVGKGNAVVDNLLTQKITLLQRQIDSIVSDIKTPQPAAQITPEVIEWLKKQIDNFAKLEMFRKTDVVKSIVKVVWVDKNGEAETEHLF